MRNRRSALFAGVRAADLKVRWHSANARVTGVCVQDRIHSHLINSRLTAQPWTDKSWLSDLQRLGGAGAGTGDSAAVPRALRFRGGARPSRW